MPGLAPGDKVPLTLTVLPVARTVPLPASVWVAPTLKVVPAMPATLRAVLLLIWIRDELAMVAAPDKASVPPVMVVSPL